MRNYVMELVGTFFLTAALTFTGLNPVAVGLMLIVLMYVGHHVSGGHYNPAISLALFARKSIKLDEFFLYAAMQTIGAFAGLWMFAWISGSPFSIEGISDVAPTIEFVVEMILVGLFALLWITVTSSSHYKASDIFGVAIGLALMAILLIGGLFNPAIAIAALIYNWAIGIDTVLRELFVYITAPLVGGVLGALAYDYFNKRGAK